MKVDFFRSLVAQHLPSRRRWADGTAIRRRVWRRLYLYYSSGRKPVRLRLHGRMLTLEAGSPYPFLLVEAPHLNSGLVAATASLTRHFGRPLRIVDLGASVGDTIALLAERVPNSIGSCLCVDGAPEKRPFFEVNTAGIPGITFYVAMLSARGAAMPSLVRHRPDTAAARGGMRVESRTLDELLLESPLRGTCDLLKIDLDGYDGEALLGGIGMLARCQPLVIFEWHPHLIQACGNDHRAPFRALSGTGYRRFLWYSNLGTFSHRSEIPADEEIDWWRDFLLAKQQPRDPHFDIIAVPPKLETLVDSIALASVYPG